jgi:hypothetical protein
MARRSLIAWLLVLCLGLLACGVGAVAFGAMIMALYFELASAALLAELAIYVWLMAVLEIAITAAIWATRGPIMALAWVLARVAAWQGG